MRRSLLIAAAVLALLAQPASADDPPPKGDLAKLQGIWKGKSGPNGNVDLVMTIKGNTGTTVGTIADGRKLTATFKFTIDEDAKPHKTMDAFEFVRSGGGVGADHLYSIYMFNDNNTVVICNSNDKYPSEFKAGENGSPSIHTLKRVTDKDKKVK